MGRRDGPDAHRSAKSVAVACESDLRDDRTERLRMQFLFTLVEMQQEHASLDETGIP